MLMMLVGQELTSSKNLLIPNQNDKSIPAAKAVAAPARVIPDEDKTILQSLLGDATTTSILELYDLTVASGHKRLDAKTNSVNFPPMEREVRSKVHGVSDCPQDTGVKLADT